MSDLSPGKILVADHEGVYVIKMLGDVRLTLCMSFDDFIENITKKSDFFTVMFDLSEAVGLDSTTLGLIAKLAVNGKSKLQNKPLIICTDVGINRLLSSMGLDDICELIDVPPQEYCNVSNFVNLDKVDELQDEEQIKAKVLESHCVLMNLNESNRETFKDLIETLKAS